MIKVIKLSDDELELCERACSLVISECEGWWSDKEIEKFKELADKLNAYNSKKVLDDDEL